MHAVYLCQKLRIQYLCSQVDCELEPPERNSHGGAFRAVETDLTSEKAARRWVDPMKARTWKVSNPQRSHPITGALQISFLNDFSAQQYHP